MVYRNDPHWMTARFNSTCSDCKAPIKKSEQIFYYPKGKHVMGEKCGCARKAEQDFYNCREAEEFYNR